MGDMEIRPCTDDDLAALSSRWKAHGDVHESHHSGQLAGDTTYLVAWRDGEPLGSGVVQWDGCIGPNAREAFPRAVEINHLQVRDEYRSQGVGTALIAAAEQLIGRERMSQAAVGVSMTIPMPNACIWVWGTAGPGLLMSVDTHGSRTMELSSRPVNAINCSSRT
jgi:GNAT superfamily N-acetyltransferase